MFWDTRNLTAPVTKVWSHDNTSRKWVRSHGISSLSQDLNRMYISASCMDSSRLCTKASLLNSPQNTRAGHSLFINCGGLATFFKGNEYEEDSTDERSYFYSNPGKWAYSTNGVFTGNDHAPYIATTTNVTGGNIYRTARLSPASLRYYGLCLRKGSYKVTLHFAETGYSDDMTFSSLGRRYFDVSVQGVLIRKDFNIMEAAKGVHRGTIIKSDNVIVNGSTIEIHLYWAGKGTTAVPY